MPICRPRAARAVLLPLLLVAVSSDLRSAESRRRRDDRRSTLSRNTAGGGDFPTWEREVDSDERSRLPEGPPGRFVPAWTADLGSPATGVAALGGDLLVAPLADGRIRTLHADGTELRTEEGGGRITLPPVEAGALVLVAAGERLVAVSRNGIAWRSEPGGRIVHAPARSDDAAFIAREGGTLQAVRVADGSTAWSVALGGESACAPSVAGPLVVIGLGGDVVGFDGSSGAEKFRLPLGDRVDSVTASTTTLLAAGLGRSGRSRDVTPVVAGWDIRGRDAMPSGRPWRLRVGGSCPAGARMLDDLAVFTCADGYVRAIDRRKGVGGWKTDLPQASTAGPVVSGSRLDYVIPQSRHAVALQVDDGAVLGWVTLPDEDETFVGTAAGAGAITAAATSFSRLVGWRWEWIDEEGADEEDDRKGRPGEDAEDAQRRGLTIPIVR